MMVFLKFEENCDKFLENNVRFYGRYASVKLKNDEG